MANEEYVNRLKQGVETWNQWVNEHYLVEPESVRRRREQEPEMNWWGYLSVESLRKLDLGGADLSGRDLREVLLIQANLDRATLRNADLSGARLGEAHLAKADLGGANLKKADLHDVNLYNANLADTNLNNANLDGANLDNARFDGASLFRTSFRGASLEGVDLTGIRDGDLGQQDLAHAKLMGANLGNLDLSQADLSGADLRGANLAGARLIMADLRGANLGRAILDGADMTFSRVGATTFCGVDLSAVSGLDSVDHGGASAIDIETLLKSKGKLAAEFLAGCGVPEHFADRIPSLVGATDAAGFHSCFISYSTEDEAFARKLHARLKEANVRVWFAPEKIRGGKILDEQLELAIRSHDRLLIALSKSSMRSEWVNTEIRYARRVAITENRRKLFPLRLVDLETIDAWTCFDPVLNEDLAFEVRNFFIPDFTDWTKEAAFEAGVDRLLRDLRADDGDAAARRAAPR